MNIVRTKNLEACWFIPAASMCNVLGDGTRVPFQVDFGESRDEIYWSLDEQGVGSGVLLMVTKGANESLDTFNSRHLPSAMDNIGNIGQLWVSDRVVY